MSESEFRLVWTEGTWSPDKQADTFTATRGRQQIVVRFEEETPKLITPKVLAEHQAA